MWLPAAGRKSNHIRPLKFYWLFESCEGALPAGLAGVALVSERVLSDVGGVTVPEAGEVFVSFLLEALGFGAPEGVASDVVVVVAGVVVSVVAGVVGGGGVVTLLVVASALLEAAPLSRLQPDKPARRHTALNARVVERRW